MVWSDPGRRSSLVVRQVFVDKLLPRILYIYSLHKHAHTVLYEEMINDDVRRKDYLSAKCAFSQH